MYRLLIADADAETRNGLCNFFPWSQLGFELVGPAEDGLRALKIINAGAADVVLCEIRLPVLNGIELARQLCENQSRVKVLFLSSHRDFESAREALSCGVREYLLKPAKYDILAAVFTRIRQELDRERGMADGPVEPLQSGAYHDQMIRIVKFYIETHYTSATLEGASRLVHFNPYYLSRFFKDKTGENFSDYILTVKMRKAAVLLRDISYKTYQISEMVGYSNPKNFSRIFKRFFGKTPTEFRNSP